jgi:hypothetical protein
MKKEACYYFSAFLLALATGCATGRGDFIDTSRLSLVKENRAQITKNGATYALDTYIILFQRPYYVLVRQNLNKTIELSEAEAIATEYIKPRGCTTPINRRPDLDRSNSTKTQWLIGIEC